MRISVLLGILGLLVVPWVVGPANADPHGGYNRWERQGRYGYAAPWYGEHKHEHKRPGHTHRHKHGLHRYKAKGHIKRGPPPWAAAHGHRRTCYTPRRPHGYVSPSAVVHYGWSRQQVGVVIGGATGGLLGTHIGKGSGRTAAIIGGTVLGALVGGSIGQSMDRVDHLWVEQTLEYVPSNESVRWQNPDTRVTYEVAPVATYEDPVGRYCREYRTTAIIGGERQQVYGTACRQPDGSWQIAD